MYRGRNGISKSQRKVASNRPRPKLNDRTEVDSSSSCIVVVVVVVVMVVVVVV